jgi:hypothetical protein
MVGRVRTVDALAADERNAESTRAARFTYAGLEGEAVSGAASRIGRRSSAWALAYLRGRAAAFNRGSVTRANVDGGVQLALRYGASLEDVQRVLADFRLLWDAARQQVTRLE